MQCASRFNPRNRCGFDRDNPESNGGPFAFIIREDRELSPEDTILEVFPELEDEIYFGVSDDEEGRQQVRAKLREILLKASSPTANGSFHPQGDTDRQGPPHGLRRCS